MTAQEDRADDQEPEDDYDDERDDYPEPDGDDYENARWYAEEAEHFEKVHGDTGVCDCRPPLAERLRWSANRVFNRARGAWLTVTAATRHPCTVRAGRLEVTLRWTRERPCGACGGRGWNYSLDRGRPDDRPPGYNGVGLCGCGSAIGQLADSRRQMRQWDKEPPF